MDDLYEYLKITEILNELYGCTVKALTYLKMQKYGEAEDVLFDEMRYFKDRIPYYAKGSEQIIESNIEFLRKI